MQDREGDVGSDHGDRHDYVVIGGISVEPPPGDDRRRDVAISDRGPEIVGHGDKDAYRFGEPERRQCEIGAFQTKRRHPDNGADEPGRQGRERQREPERQTELGAEYRRGIGADRRKGDMPDINLAGEPLDDVESDRQHDIDHDQIEQVLLVAVGGRQRQRQQRHESGAPAASRMRRDRAGERSAPKSH